MFFSSFLEFGKVLAYKHNKCDFEKGQGKSMIQENKDWTTYKN